MNLFLLTKNRKFENIILISGNPFRVVAAMDLGFCGIPIIKFTNFMQNDYQLNLLENYLIKLKYSNDMKSKNTTDFGFLRHTTALNKRKMFKTDSEVSEKENSKEDHQIK